jgi:TonB family protein
MHLTLQSHPSAPRARGVRNLLVPLSGTAGVHALLIAGLFAIHSGGSRENLSAAPRRVVLIAPSLPRPARSLSKYRPVPKPAIANAGRRQFQMPRAAQHPANVPKSVPQIEAAIVLPSNPSDLRQLAMLRVPAPAVNAETILPPAQKPPVVLGAFGKAEPSAAEPQGVAARKTQSGVFEAVRMGAPIPMQRMSSAAGFGDVRSVDRPEAVPQAPSAATGVFGDIRAGSPSRDLPKTDLSKSASQAAKAVEIISKPRPRYTEEARRLQIEGDVVFEILFTAAGEVRVLKTLSGLGHGLDESALNAAKAIRFRPAERNGVPVDSLATVRIRFELAY